MTTGNLFSTSDPAKGFGCPKDLFKWGLNNPKTNLWPPVTNITQISISDPAKGFGCPKDLFKWGLNNPKTNLRPPVTNIAQISISDPAKGFGCPKKGWVVSRTNWVTAVGSAENPSSRSLHETEAALFGCSIELSFAVVPTWAPRHSHEWNRSHRGLWQSHRN